MRRYDCLDHDLPHLGCHAFEPAKPKEFHIREITTLVIYFTAHVEWVAARRVEIKTSIFPE